MPGKPDPIGGIKSRVKKVVKAVKKAGSSVRDKASKTSQYKVVDRAVKANKKFRGK